MLALLPVIGFGALLASLYADQPSLGVRGLILRAYVLWGALSVLLMEALSLGRAITPAALSALWAAGIAVAALRLIRLARAGRFPEMPRVRPPGDWFLGLGLGLLLAIGAATFLVAWISPPNTWDSLTYHMSRVAHWAQERSVRHFATGIERQNFMSPGAEMLVLQGYVLSRGDRLANLTEWSSMLISLVGVSWIAKKVGANSAGQLVASVYAATLPMGIAQASSTMTDYVLGAWMVCLAAETVDHLQGQGLPRALPYVGLAAGLAILTKPTAFAFLAPFAVLYVYILLRRGGLQTLVRGSLRVAACVAVLNLGYLARNFAHYGSPLGARERVEEHSNEVMNWRVALSNVLRNASLHSGTRSDKLNEFTYVTLAKVHAKLGLDLNDPRTSVHSHFAIFEPSLDESRAANVAHAVVLLIAAPLLCWFHRRHAPLLMYAAAVFGGFLVLSIMIKFSIFASRYHLPFFVLSGPLVGVLLGAVPFRFVAALVSAWLAFSAWPWLTQIENRPLLPGSGAAASILNRGREEQYLGRQAAGVYRDLAAHILSSGCRQVGIMYGGNSPEYLVWAFLGSPRRDAQVEWIIGENDLSSRYRKVDFQPCALVCETCPPDWETFRGMPIFVELSGIRLFMQGD
jgi:hypothetical protein